MNLSTSLANCAIRRRLRSLACLCLLCAGSTAAQETSRKIVRVPAIDIGVNLLETRRQAQLATRDQFQVPIDFSFSDRQPESGLTFEHQPVDDSLKSWKPVHYDHGNGVAVADIDADGLIDIYLTSQLGGNQLWRNLGNARFENVTDEAGVGLRDRIGVSATFADIDNDGDPDLFTTSVRTGNALFENEGGRFRDISRTAGVDYSGHSSGAIFFDYDNDGLLDLFVTNVGSYTYESRGRGGFYIGREDAFEGHLYPERTERSLLYRNLGSNRFEEVAEKVGLLDESWSGDASFVDFNRDRYPDLYVLNMQGDDHYYENRTGERFVDRTREFFPLTSWGAMGIKFFDFDRDGQEDLLITDMHSDMVPEGLEPLFEKSKPFGVMVKDTENNIAGNSFYLQQADGTFSEQSDALGAENYWPWGISVDDLNADGFDDVFIASSMNYPYRYGINSVLINHRGQRFLDAEFILGVEPRRGGRTEKPAFDLDCGGADREHELCAGIDGPLTVVGALGTRSSVIFDLDGDGDLDIVTNEFNDVSQVLVSDLAQRHPVHWLLVDLTGTMTNRDGLGARVTVSTPQGAITKTYDGKSGYLAQSALPLYFGLGTADAVDRISIDWPSGIRQVVTEGIETNSRIVIEESQSE